MPISAPGPATVAPPPIQHDAGVPPPHTPAEVASPPPADDGRVQNEPLRLHGQSGHLSLLRDAPDGWHHGAQPAIAHKPHAQLDGPPGHGSAHQPAAPIGAASEFRLSDMNLAPGIAQQARVGPLQRDIATAFRPAPIGGALSGLMGSSIAGPGAAAAGPLGSNPVSGQLLPAGGVLVQLKSQAPADPAAPQPAPPTTATPEAAAPQAAEPVAPAAPSADPAEIGALELVLADPANQEMIRHFGGELKPLPTWTSVGKGIEARYGADLAGRLYQLQTAQRAVEGEFFEAMDQARRNPPKSTPHYFPRRGDPLPTADQPGWVYKPGDGHWDGNGPSWEFDPGVFARDYAQGDTPAQRAFAHLHGPDPVQFIPAPDTETGGSAEWVLSGVTLREGRRLSFDEGLTPDSVVAKDGWAPSRLLRGEHFLDPDRITKLNNKEFVWFDPVHGFSTDPDNIKGDWLDRAFPYLFSAAFTAMTFGAGAGVGAAAVAGSAGTGASMGLGATISAAVGGGTAGTIAVGAATGAVSSATLQLAANGKINFGQVLQSALAGGATAGISKIPRIGEFLDGKAPSFGQRLMEHTGRATVQGAIQSVMGGKFRDGMVNSLIGSLAGEVTTQIDAQIEGIQGLDPSQAGALRLLSRATGSALRLAGSNDPAAGFASDFLGGLMRDALISEAPQDAGGEPESPADPLGDFIAQNEQAWADRQAAYDQMVATFGLPPAIGRGQDTLLAAGPGFTDLGEDGLGPDGVYRVTITGTSAEFAQEQLARIDRQLQGSGGNGSSRAALYNELVLDSFRDMNAADQRVVLAALDNYANSLHDVDSLTRAGLSPGSLEARRADLAVRIAADLARQSGAIPDNARFMADARAGMETGLAAMIGAVVGRERLTASDRLTGPAATGAGRSGGLDFGANNRKLDFLFNNNIDQAKPYNARRSAGNASRIGMADTPANRAEVTRLFNEAYNDASTIVGPGRLPGSNVREFFLPGVTGTGSKIQFVEHNGRIITIMAM